MMDKLVSDYIRRPDYTDKIIPFTGKQIIKIITGQRRVGKSYLLFQLMDDIRQKTPDANIIYINHELEDYASIQTHKDLLNYVKNKLKPTVGNYLFVDEIQEVKSFQLALRSLFAKNSCDIFCTGSNAKMLSGELATHLAGRYVEFTIHSLSYTEFLRFHKFENNRDALVKYLTFGGMPYLANIGIEEHLAFEYLRNVYTTILLKDVVSRENIRNISFLENLVYFLSDNIGSLFSAANISKFLKSQRIDISPQLTISYLKALSNAYFVHKVIRSEIGGLKIFEIGEKYYFEDLGLRNALKGFHQIADTHKLLENAVYLHLIQNNYRVYVGKIGNREIDFVADKNGQKVYIQTSLTLSHTAETAQREFGNLLEIKDNYPKYVITLNDVIIGKNYQGIMQINLGDFLTNFK
ncbi:MAG: ATP-binding protein [Prevotellaceae bacterium]|jgi:predicted AAA+ superfamily ATPase|nr:ATP-binding protein [Prevotellaceae bacterium]